MEAPDARAVVERLHKEAYYPIRVAPHVERRAWLTLGGSGRVRQRDLLAFSQQLATLFEAGLPLDRALSILEALAPNPRVKTIVGDGQPLSSVTSVWPSANWLEREIYDMFGVSITGHPDRRRILMPEDWQGFPQRKDYPLEGPGELLMENPLDWLKLRQAKEEADIE